MKFAVCVKAVPDAAAGRRLDPSTKRLDRSGELTISEWDTYPIEEALKLKEAAGEGEVVVLSTGPARRSQWEPTARSSSATRPSKARICSEPPRRLPARSSAKAPTSFSSGSSRPTAAVRASGP